MICIDGSTLELRIEEFANLEEILVHIAQDEHLKERVITDVFVNDELFSELYPHQAEDISAETIQKLEIRSMPVYEMAFNMVKELFKVDQLMINSSLDIVKLLRASQKDEALELFQDLLEVIRDFMSMVGVLRSDVVQGDLADIKAGIEKMANLLSEITEALQNEDWILMADLLEYEFQEYCEHWKQILDELRQKLGEEVGK